MTSNQCSKYPPVPFIYSFIHSLMLLEKQLCSSLTNTKLSIAITLSKYCDQRVFMKAQFMKMPSTSIYPRDIYISVSWYKTEKNLVRKKYPSSRDPSPLSLFHFLLTGVFSMIHINYLQSMCSTFGIGHFSKILSIF